MQNNVFGGEHRHFPKNENRHNGNNQTLQTSTTNYQASSNISSSRLMSSTLDFGTPLSLYSLLKSQSKYEDVKYLNNCIREENLKRGKSKG